MKLSDYIRPANNTRLGLHWTPVTGHAHADLTRYIDRAAQMGIGWVMLIDDGGGSTLEPNKFYGGKSIVDMWLERGVVPVIRFFAAPWARFDSRFEDTTRRLVKRGVRYIFWMNEPECGGEWADRGRSIDRNWVYNCTRLFVDGAYKMIKIGAYPGWWATTTFRWTTPDGKRRVNPFLEYMTPQERRDIFIDGGGWIPIHNYSKNHPIDYPDDSVNQLGQPLTREEYLVKIAEVDKEYRRRTKDMWVWNSWETSEHHINLLRRERKNPGQTIEDDDTCFRMYRGLLKLLDEAGIKDYVPFIATEAGPCVGERDDGRYPRVTPKAQIEMIEAELSEASMVSSFFGLCFWLAGVQLLDAATADGFEDQGWWTARHNEPFKLNNELPIVQYLIDRRNRVNTSKLCPHVQYLDEPTLGAIRRVKPPMVKIMNATRKQLENIRAASPNSLIVARVYQENQDYQTDPVAAGRAFANCYADIIDLIDVAEVFNEAINSLADMNTCRKFDDYQVAFARRLWELRPEVKVGLFCLPTGNFGWPGEPALTPAWFPHSMNLPADRCYICVHEYTWHDLRWEFGARMCRYRRQMEWAKEIGFKLLITECGFTQAVLAGKPDVGWRSDPKTWQRERYVQSLREYDTELRKDDYVIGAAIFTCGRNSGWDTFESLAEWEAAANTPITLLPPEPEDEEDDDMLEPNLRDADKYGIKLLYGYVPEGSKGFKIVKVYHYPVGKNGGFPGNRNLFMDVLDENGRRMYGAKIEVTNMGNGQVHTAIIDKPANEPGTNVPINPGDTLKVRVKGDYQSDVAEGIHTRHPDEGEDVRVAHHSFLIVWQLTENKPDVKPEPKPEPPPAEVTESDIRNAAWNRVYPEGIAYNPNAAFPVFAKRHSLGVPVTAEFDIGPYRVQGYANGIVYARIGDWGNIKLLEWQ